MMLILPPSNAFLVLTVFDILLHKFRIVSYISISSLLADHIIVERFDRGVFWRSHIEWNDQGCSG